MNKEKLLGQIDSTLLRPNITGADLVKLCEDAMTFNFASVCVHPIHIKFCKKQLKNNRFKVKVTTVAAFPFGEVCTKNKIREVKEAFRAGADEVDFVISISSVKEGKWDYVAKEIEKVVKASKNKTLKAIIETAYLTDEEIKKVCEICVKSNVRFIKTSTGFGGKGAELRTVQIINDAIYEAGRIKGDEMHPCEIKVSGGIKTMDDVVAFSKAGAVRFGTSCACDIAMSEVKPGSLEEEAAQDAETFDETPTEVHETEETAAEESDE